MRFRVTLFVVCSFWTFALFTNGGHDEQHCDGHGIRESSAFGELGLGFCSVLFSTVYP